MGLRKKDRVLQLTELSQCGTFNPGKEGITRRWTGIETEQGEKEGKKGRRRMEEE